MSKTTLREALEGWGERTRASGEHIGRPALYELLLKGPPSGREEMLDHLARCPVCLRALQELDEGIQEAESRFAHWDVALPKAAAAPGEGPRHIATEGGRFTIEVRRHLTTPGKGIITVQVSQQFREALEGRGIVLRDGKGRVLLEGRIINGEVSQEIPDLDEMDYALMVGVAES